MSDDGTGDGSGDGTDGSAAGAVRSYYAALRAGDPIAPAFASGEGVVKCGVFSRRVGGDAVAAGLRDQTAATTDWTVESRDLRVTERDDHAWFADAVAMGWRDEGRDRRYDVETRWTGVLERRGPDGEVDPTGEWRFASVHVSTADARSPDAATAEANDGERGTGRSDR